MRRLSLACLLLGACIRTEGEPPCSVIEQHRELLTLDAHLDTPMHFERAEWSFGDRHAGSGLVQVDLPRMRTGALDGGFFAIYTPQGPLTANGYAEALRSAQKRSDAIDAVLQHFSNKIALARSADEVEQITDEGRLAALKSMENSYPLGEDLARLADFYRRGVRLAGPVHASNNQFADSATDSPVWNGLSPLGREWAAEMNRLGIVIDASHASDDAFDQMLALSKTPLLLSHSGAQRIFDHPRNLDDNRIRKLTAAGGAICVTTAFLSPMNLTEEWAELFAQLEHIGDISPKEQAEMTARWRALRERDPLWKADFDDFMRALLHVIDVAGVNHTCIGADWDGGGGIDGLADISDLPRITEGLRASGYSSAEIEKIWSGNILRILRAAETQAVQYRQ